MIQPAAAKTFRLTQSHSVNQARSTFRCTISDLATLKELLENLKKACDDPDRARPARRELKKLKIKAGIIYMSFSLYLAEFHRLMETSK
jgi:hypothetical protein